MQGLRRSGRHASARAGGENIRHDAAGRLTSCPPGRAQRRGRGSSPAIAEPLERRVFLNGEVTVPTVTGLVLVDADANQDIVALADGMSFDLALMSDVNVRADTAGPVARVQFGLDGKENFRSEGSAPYALAGDRDGDYHDWNVKPGVRVITATPFDAAGVAGAAVTVTVEFSFTGPDRMNASAVSYDEVRVRWDDNSDDETMFLVERSTDGSSFAPLAFLPANTEELIDTQVQPGVTYRYRVSAETWYGRSRYGTISSALIAEAAPDAPSAPEAEPYSYGQVDLQWDDEASNEQGYLIQRSTDGATFVTIGTVGADQETSFSDTTAGPETLYHYRVAAYNPYGLSAFSSVVTAETYAQPPLDERPGPHDTGPFDPSVLAPSGSIDVEVDGTVIENLDVAGGITVRANNVIIRNNRITANSLYGIRIESGYTNVLVEYNEVRNASSTGIYSQTPSAGGTYTLRRNYVHDIGGDGIKASSGAVIEENYVTRLGLADGAHADGIQISEGVGIVIRGNYFDMPVGDDGTSSNATIFIKPDFGPIDDVLIEDNWLNGGNYTVFLATKGEDEPTNVLITNNWFGRDYRFAAKNTPGETNVFEEDNWWWDTGAPVI